MTKHYYKHWHRSSRCTPTSVHPDIRFPFIVSEKIFGFKGLSVKVYCPLSASTGQRHPSLPNLLLCVAASRPHRVGSQLSRRHFLLVATPLLRSFLLFAGLSKRTRLDADVDEVSRFHPTPRMSCAAAALHSQHAAHISGPHR